MGRHRLQRRGRYLSPDQQPLRFALKTRAVAVNGPQPEFGKLRADNQLLARRRVLIVQHQRERARLKRDHRASFRACQPPPDPG